MPNMKPLDPQQIEEQKRAKLMAVLAVLRRDLLNLPAHATGAQSRDT